MSTATLPARLAAYVERNLPARLREQPRVVISQAGTMRLKPDAKPRPFTAEQWFATGEVEFCWHARVSMAPLVTAVVEDAYEDGHGRLDAKIWGRFSVAHDEGPAIDRGEVQRYLAELVWNPVALLRNPALRYEERDDGAIRVSTIDPQIHVDLHFDEHGDVVRTYAMRDRGDQGTAPWEGQFFEYGERGGVRMPTRGEVAWLLPEGRYTYWYGEILDASWG